MPHREVIGIEIQPNKAKDRIEDLVTDERGDSGLQSVVTRMVEEAILWQEEHLEPEWERATDYYMGEKFGNEEAGRSQIVSTDVRDAVQAMLPSLMRIFWGSEDAVAYGPNGPEDVAGAEQATDYINKVVIGQDNPGFLVMHAAFKDALIRKLGVIKWWWEDKEKVESEEYSGLTDQEVQVLMSEPDLEIEDLEGTDDGEEISFSLRVIRRTDEGVARFAALPPEEFVFSPNARDLNDARMVAHLREMRSDELVAMGIDEDLVADHRGTQRGTATTGSDSLESARRIDDDDREEEDAQPEETRPVLFTEVYMYVDLDDDGIAELRRFQCVGAAFEIVPDDEGELLGTIVDERPFAVFGPDPEPHTMVGLSISDYIEDIQLIKSNIIRGMLDSLNLSLNPQQEAVSGQVNMKDLMNPEIGSVVRVRQPGMLREIRHEFVGAEAFPMVQYMDELKENRTGISKAAAGLDPDALQSSTKAAVAATLTSAQQHIEMIARIFAETGMKQLYAGLLRLVISHQDRERVVRLRNRFVNVDPRTWNSGMDVRTNVALGQGLTEEKIQTLQIIMAEQKEQLQQGSPLVSLVEFRRTLGRFIELTGWPGVDEFFKPFTEEDAQKMQEAQAQAPPPPPDPAMLLVQVEQSKVQLQGQKDAAELALRREEMQLKDDRERDKIARESALKELEIEAKYQVDIEDSRLRAAVARDRAAMDADVKAKQAQAAAASAAQGGNQ